MKTILLLAPIAAALLFSTAHAQVSLVGAAYYSANSDGSDASSGYLYTTNGSESGYDIGNLNLTLNGNAQNSEIEFDLAEGANVFTFASSGGVSPGDYAGLELFFAPTTGAGSGSYNPSDTGIAGDLAVFVPTTGETGAADYVPGDTLVEDYGTGFGTATYTGATSFILGDNIITLSDLSSDATTAGSFTIYVTAVPEPSTWALMLTGLVGFGFLGRYVRQIA